MRSLPGLRATRGSTCYCTQVLPWQQGWDWRGVPLLPTTRCACTFWKRPWEGGRLSSTGGEGCRPCRRHDPVDIGQCGNERQGHVKVISKRVVYARCGGDAVKYLLHTLMNLVSVGHVVHLPFGRTHRHRTGPQLSERRAALPSRRPWTY